MVAGADGLTKMAKEEVTDATEEGAIVYDAINKTLAVCDGTNWVVLSGDPLRTDCGVTSRLEWDGTEWQCTVTVEACLTGPIGTRCTSDGAIYAGDTVGGARMYAAACDHGMTWNGTACTGSQTGRPWKTSTTTTAGTTSLTDGVVNTDAMATAGIALHPAAQACRNAGAEWYLPARDELDLLYDNLVGQGDTTPGGPLGSTFDFNITGSLPAGWYWSSKESNSFLARGQRFSDGNQSDNGKHGGFAVRCVRR